MTLLLKTGSPQAVRDGAVVGGLLYTPTSSNNETVELLKSSPPGVIVDLPYATPDDAVDVLNAGARAVLVRSVAQQAAFVESGVPQARIVVYAGDLSRDEASALLGETSAETSAETGGLLAASAAQAAELATLASEHAARRGAAPTPVFEAFESETALVAKFTGSLSSDRADGLYTTAVVDMRHRLLGVCFSSAESLAEAVASRTGVYQSRRRGLWRKGASSGATQRLLRVTADCDGDALEFVVAQTPPGFCHNNTASCFGGLGGLDLLEQTVQQRTSAAAPAASYTKRLLSERGLLEAKIREEADELCEAHTRDEVAWEAADLLYFVGVKLAKHGMSWADVEENLDRKSLKVTRRRGDAKPGYAKPDAKPATPAAPAAAETAAAAESKPAAAAPAAAGADAASAISIPVVSFDDRAAVVEALTRPAQTSNAFELTRPIVEAVRTRGDAALLEYTARFERAQLSSPVLRAPFPAELMRLEPALQRSIDLACDNVEKFHAAQITPPLTVETCRGVVCRRFSRPIARVGLYVPGGTAILPSTAIHLGVPAKVAGCSDIVVATPPRSDGTPSPEVLYVAHKIGAKQVVLAGGAQGVAAMAYGTESVTKVDKILGPGNQFVTAAKMLCSTDVNAQVSIDMPAGPSEVLVVADKAASKRFVVSDLLSQAEHGADSQVVLISIGWDRTDVEELQRELDRQAKLLPRCDVVRKSIAHSAAINVPDITTAFDLSNQYAPEHLILQIADASKYVDLVQNAGSVFVGALSPESCGDYTSGTNHTLPTYGYANQYSGVNTDTYLKYITSQELSVEGLRSIGDATVVLAECEGLRAHANAVRVRLEDMQV